MTGMLVDINAHKATEAALQAAREEAERVSRATSSFLANMSHELRTPMNGVLGFAELLLGTSLDQEQRRYAQHVHDAGATLLALLNDILDLTHEAFDVHDLIRQCDALMTPVAERKALNLRVDLDPQLPTWLMGDSLRLRQIVLNLLGNAVKFTERGSVTVTARPYGSAGGAPVLVPCP